MINRTDLSVVIVAFDMARELPRTLRSLLPPHQTGIDPSAVQFIIADNGSTEPVRRTDFPADADITVICVEDGGVSPCRAVNRAAELARGTNIAVMVDGARMASPGLLAAGFKAVHIDPRAFVATLGLHLGPKVQQISTTEGYDREAEDALLTGIGWPGDGYRLFEISALGESYAQGVLVAPPETTFFVMNRQRFVDIGGFDERFVSLGGGFANFDVFARALGDADAPLVMLVGEATFHQLHFGATTREGASAGRSRRLASRSVMFMPPSTPPFGGSIGRGRTVVRCCSARSLTRECPVCSFPQMPREKAPPLSSRSLN